MSDRAFDLRTISLGAGVQSTALYLMALDGIVGPRPDAAIFADTQQEPPWVYENLERLRKEGGDRIPIYTPTCGDLGDAVMKKIGATPGRFASVPFWVKYPDGSRGAGQRQCTRDYKIDVVVQQVRRLLGVPKRGRASGKYKVEEWIGISADEAHRAKPSRHDYITSRWPFLYDFEPPMRRVAIVKWLAARGWGEVGKSACVFCPYRSIAEWNAWRNDHPELFDLACKWDEKIRDGSRAGMHLPQYVSHQLVPLREVSDPTDQLDLFGNECEGICGI